MIQRASRAGAAAAALAVGAAIAASAPARAFQSAVLNTQELKSVGWRGFLDVSFLTESVGALLLAIALGALIAYHPMARRTVDTFEEAELPKVYILYALVGAMVGVTVLEYGIVIGFVVFGLGGLMRFRTTTETTRDTGRLIIVTLLGLISGLNLPHFAVLAAFFAFVLIFVFEANPICRIQIRQLPEASVAAAAAVYRAALGEAKCTILSEKKSFSKRRVDFVFRMPLRCDKERLETQLAERVPAELRGEVDWEVD